MSIDYGAVLLIGFLSSFGHCIGMCGGFVVAYSLKINQQTSGGARTAPAMLTPHLLYNFGRVFTYMILGALFALVGETLGVVLGIRHYQGVLQLVAGILMVLIGLDMGGWIPTVFSEKFPGYQKFKQIFNTVLNRVNRRNVFGLGMVLGFIPCGLVYAVGAKAAAAGNITGGMLTMLFFGLGTFPAMIAVGVSANAVSAKFRGTVFKIATVLVILLGIATIYRGGRALATPPPISSASADINCVTR